MKERLSLQTKTIFGLGGMALLAVAISSAVMAFVWETRAYHRRLGEEVSELIIVADMRSALLEENLALGAYLAEGGAPARLQEISSSAEAFRTKFREFEALADTPIEQEALARIRQAVSRYDASRDEVLALGAGDRQPEARAAYLDKTSELYSQTMAILGQAIKADKGETRTALSASDRQMSHLMVFVTAGAALTALLGAGIVWLLFSGIFSPLKRMAEDCRSHLPDFPGAKLANRGRQGDLTLLGMYLRTLMAEVDKTHSDLEKNRGSSPQSERLAAIGGVVACVAHEIKNALTSIGGFARFIERKPDDPRRVREEAQIILKVATRLERMVRETMDYSRPMTITPELQSLNTLVADAMVTVTAKTPEAVRLEMDLDPAIPKLPLDASYLTDVVTNLIQNAVEAVGENGQVWVETRPHQVGAMLVVRDTGPGISAEQQKRMFEPFFTTKKHGNGLGLAICRQIVRSHGGDIRFSSEPGKGTTFTVTLPAAGVGTEPCRGLRPAVSDRFTPGAEGPAAKTSPAGS
ncbi:MAG TPA: ATP-binding protein [Planctomycetota bacterium]|nr:ATP-binding protein [Planctomycetota bacterium]